MLFDEQQAALTAIKNFLLGNDKFFLLSGSAGTGKTYLIRELIEQTKGRFVFTAPTNKATKVLRESVTSKDYKPECRTIYSLLGLRLEANGEVKELSVPEDPIDLSAYSAVIVDEGSMVNSQLFSHIKSTTGLFNVKFIFMGDPAQLPPVGEQASPIWKIEARAHLETVRRHDNQILELATRIRKQVDRIAPNIQLVTNCFQEEGVWSLTQKDFQQSMLYDINNSMDFLQPERAKVIAWRNVTVDKYNALIRSTIFPGLEAYEPWTPDDRVIFTQPAKDFDDEIVATTDDEGKVNRVTVEYHPIQREFKCHRVSIVLDDNRPVVAWVLHPESQMAFARRLEELGAAARENRRLWGKFWDFKESFHSLRHAYAITAHRAQGSTYDTAYVDYRDILLNRNRSEAFRCLYVACTRPKRRLILG